MRESGKSLIRKIILNILAPGLLFLIFISCSRNIKQQIGDVTQNPGDYLIAWAHSDIQPRVDEERIFYERAIADINENFPDVYMSLVAGDIVHRSNSEPDFRWYNAIKKKTRIRYWYEIAGNHDQYDGENFLKYIGLPLHYSVEIGNMLILCLSDENSNHVCTISEPAFEWWKNMVINNQDKIIITMTHAYVKKSGLFLSHISHRNINHSERFAEVLKKYRVDMWLCAHTHLPHYVKGSIRIVPELNNTIFINVSAIRGERNIKGAESFLLYFRQDSDKVIIRSRNHDKRKFNKYYDMEYSLSKNLVYDKNEPVIKSMNGLLTERKIYEEKK